MAIVRTGCNLIDMTEIAVAEQRILAQSERRQALQAKSTDDVQSVKSAVAQKKRDLNVRRAESRVEWLDREARLAVDYAIAMVEQAEVAVLYAVAGRMEAAEARRA